MAVDCNVQAVENDAKCFTCLPEKQLIAMQTYLLAQLWLAQNPMADITPQALLDGSKCFRDCFNYKQLYGAMVYLLCQITGGGGAGSGSNDLVANSFADRPATAPDATKAGQITYRDMSPSQTWDPLNAIWFALALAAALFFAAVAAPVARGATLTPGNFNSAQFTTNGVNPQIMGINPAIVGPTFTNLYVTNLYVTYLVSSNSVNGNIHGTTNNLAMFTPDSFSLGNSIVTQPDGNTIQINGTNSGAITLVDTGIGTPTINWGSTSRPLYLSGNTLFFSNSVPAIAAQLGTNSAKMSFGSGTGVFESTSADVTLKNSAFSFHLNSSGAVLPNNNAMALGGSGVPWDALWLGTNALSGALTSPNGTALYWNGSLIGTGAAATNYWTYDGIALQPSVAAQSLEFVSNGSLVITPDAADVPINFSANNIFGTNIILQLYSDTGGNTNVFAVTGQGAIIGGDPSGGTASPFKLGLNGSVPRLDLGGVGYNLAVGGTLWTNPSTILIDSAFGGLRIQAFTNSSSGFARLYSDITNAVTGFGFENFNSITTGNNNTGFGYRTLKSITAGQGDSAFGNSSLRDATGSFNTGFGDSSLRAAAGANNTGVGYAAGIGITSGANDTLLGYATSANANSDNYEIVIGSGVTGNGTGTLTIGDSINTAADYLFGALTLRGSEVITNSSTSTVGLAINGPSGLTADLQDWNVNGVIKALINANGSFSSLDNGTIGRMTFQFAGRSVDTGFYSPSSGTIRLVTAGNADIDFAVSGVSLLQGGAAFSAPSSGNFNFNSDTLLYRDAPNTLHQRNGGTSGSVVAQAFRESDFYTDSSNYRYSQIGWQLNANDYTISTATAGTGLNTGGAVRIAPLGITALTVNTNLSISLTKTITTPGTTGNQTINKSSGRVNFAIAATAITVTDSLIDANSIITAIPATNDATGRVISVVPGAGSFVINVVAPTAEMAVAFRVTN